MIVAPKCPRCRAVLEPRAHAGITAAICPQCGGAWLRAGDLERAVKMLAAEQRIVLKTIALLAGPVRATTLPCPHCTTSLESLTLRGVAVERCPGCHGIFLDAGEGGAIAQRVLAASGDWDEAYDTLLRTIRARWTGGMPTPWAFDVWDMSPGADFTDSSGGD
jgi:Zn-finger nucleic acid-binding protein